MSKPLWILVANSTVARCFERATPTSHLVPVANYVHPESRMHARDLEDDRGGRSQKDDAGRTSFVPRTEPKDREREEFAREVARVLEEGRANDAAIKAAKKASKKAARLGLPVEPEFEPAAE